MKLNNLLVEYLFGFRVVNGGTPFDELLGVLESRYDIDFDLKDPKFVQFYKQYIGEEPTPDKLIELIKASNQKDALKQTLLDKLPKQAAGSRQTLPNTSRGLGKLAYEFKNAVKLQGAGSALERKTLSDCIVVLGHIAQAMATGISNNIYAEEAIKLLAHVAWAANEYGWTTDAMPSTGRITNYLASSGGDIGSMFNIEMEEMKNLRNVSGPPDMDEFHKNFG